MLNPKIDFVFRKLFGSEQNKDLLISLINAVIEPDPPIVSVEIKNPFNLASYRKEKQSILDIKARDERGTWYDIEMQVEALGTYGKRALYYLAKTFVSQIRAGENYRRLHSTIGIHFLDFRFFADDRVVREFVFKDSKTNEAFPELGFLRLYFIEMPKFNKDWRQVRTALDRWVAFLNRAGELDSNSLPKQLVKEPALKRAAAELAEMELNDREREIYEGEVTKRMVDAMLIKEREEEARQEGHEQGLEQGLEQGTRKAVLAALSHRFGTMPEAILSQIERLHAEELIRLNAELFDLSSLNDVALWLSRR